jgi:hypothetical protein
MKYAWAPPISELYQAPKSPAQSDRIPIRIAFPDADELLDVDVLLLVLLLLLLLPQAATHNPHSPHNATTPSERGKRRMIPNLVTSSATFLIARLRYPFPHLSAQISRVPEPGGPPTDDTPASAGDRSSRGSAPAS